MFWSNTQAVNRAARILAKALHAEGVALSHERCLNLVARLQGFPEAMSANAALGATRKDKKKQFTFKVNSWEDLWQCIACMSDEERKGSIMVSMGCDEAGDAEFYAATLLARAQAPCIEQATSGVLEDENHILLFNQEENVLPSEGCAPISLGTKEAVLCERFCSQVELMEVMSASEARECFKEDPSYWAQKVFVLGTDDNAAWQPLLGDFVIVKRRSGLELAGYYHDGFGWVYDRQSASGWPSQAEAHLFLTQCLLEYQRATPEEKELFEVRQLPGFGQAYSTAID